MRWCWVNFKCRSVLLICIKAGQGPTALAVGAEGVVWTFFSRISFLSSFSLFLADGAIEIEILSQRPLIPKQPANRDCTPDSAFWRESQPEAELHGESQQKAIF